MGLKFGLSATTSGLALLAVAGCDQISGDFVARETRFTLENSGFNEPVCDTVREVCGTSHVALLNTPRNVVYATRAEITAQPGPEEVDADAVEITSDEEKIQPNRANNTE